MPLCFLNSHVAVARGRLSGTALWTYGKTSGTCRRPFLATDRARTAKVLISELGTASTALGLSARHSSRSDHALWRSGVGLNSEDGSLKGLYAKWTLVARVCVAQWKSGEGSCERLDKSVTFLRRTAARMYCK